MRILPTPELRGKYADLDINSVGRTAIACAAGGAGLLGESVGGALPAALGALGGAALGVKFEVSRQLRGMEHEASELSGQQG
jgi:hypothetical protein